MKTLGFTVLILFIIGTFCEASNHHKKLRWMEYKKHHMKKIPSIDEKDFLRQKHPHFKKGVCSIECPKGYVCVTEDGADGQCIERHVLRESRQLFRKHMRQMRRMHKMNKKDKRHHKFHKLHKFNKHKLHGMDFGVKRGLNAPGRVHDKANIFMKHRKFSQKHGKKFNVKHAKLSNRKMKPNDEKKALLENLADVQTLLEKSTDGKGHTVCKPKEMNSLRTRIQGWFVVMHEQQREKRHQKKHHHNISKRSAIDKKLGKVHQGKCNCLKSVMWEFHHLDSNRDHHLSHKELIPIEKQNRETCLKPLLKSCNRDNDPRLTKQEWCCCFANDDPPCAKKVAKLGSTPLLGAFIPKCTAEGYFERMQCHSSGYCWCSDLNGNEIAGTRQHVSKGQPTCEKYNALGQLKH